MGQRAVDQISEGKSRRQRRGDGYLDSALGLQAASSRISIAALLRLLRFTDRENWGTFGYSGAHHLIGPKRRVGTHQDVDGQPQRRATYDLEVSERARATAAIWLARPKVNSRKTIRSRGNSCDRSAPSPGHVTEYRTGRCLRPPTNVVATIG